MNEFSKVIIGRRWDNPNITVDVTTDAIGISMPLADFIHALSIEAGNPTMLLTVSALEKKLIQAADEVVAGMKEETKQVM